MTRDQIRTAYQAHLRQRKAALMELRTHPLQTVLQVAPVPTLSGQYALELACGHTVYRILIKDAVPRACYCHHCPSS